MAADPAQSDLMLAYGTLRVGVPPYEDVPLPVRETVCAGVRVPGRLFDLGAYPAATLHRAVLRGEPGRAGVGEAAAGVGVGEAAVGVGEAAAGVGAFVADVVRFGLDRPVADALAVFDDYEEVDPIAAPNIYRRVLIPLAGLVGVPAELAGRSAWIYEWLGPVEGLTEVPSGDWLTVLASRPGEG